MNCLSAVLLLVAVATANAGLIASSGAPVDSAAVLSGPSGTVVRSGLAYGAAPLAYSAAPIAAAYASPLAYTSAAVAAPVVRSGIIAASPYAYAAVPAGSGLEGQWIPDITEKFYDDGSYKPYIYGY